MKSAFPISSRHLLLCEPLRAEGVLALFAAARHLRTSMQAGTAGKPLHGRNLALLLGRSPGGESADLHPAAQELGASVAEVRFTEPTGTAARSDVRALARMLGRLYDAVDCGTLAPATVRQIEREAGVPVYEGLALDDHPARPLADLMTLDDHRRAPAPESSIFYLGDARTLRGRVFVSAARAIGFEVRLAQHPPPASSGPSFVVDATHHPRWTLHAASGPVSEARRAETHRRVLQTVLIDTMEKV